MCYYHQQSERTSLYLLKEKTSYEHNDFFVKVSYLSDSKNNKKTTKTKSLVITNKLKRKNKKQKTKAKRIIYDYAPN